MNQPIRINPRAQDMSNRHRPIPRPSDRQRVERTRVDPALHFDDVVAAKRLPKGVIP